MKWFVVVLIAVSSLSAQVCKPNQFDMLDWMAPQVATQNGHYNIIYPTSGTFYWVKGAAGYPWDVKNFDRTYLYDKRTENVWSDPYTYKAFELPLGIPIMHRCINIPVYPGKLDSVPVPASEAYFDVHSACGNFARDNLGYIISEIWGPSTLDVGGNLQYPLPALTHSYRYSCDPTYNNCKYKETFVFEKGVGLVQWTLYNLVNGVYVQQNQTTDNNFQLSTVAPFHPCW